MARLKAKDPTGGWTNRRKFTDEAEAWLNEHGPEMREAGASLSNIRDAVHEKFGVLVSRANILLRLRQMEGD